MGYRKITLINSTFEKSSQNDALNGRQKQAFDDISTLKLPAKTVDQWPTLVSLNDGHHAIPLNFVIDAVAIHEQTTWVMPVIGKESRTVQLKTNETSNEGYVALIGNLVKTSGVYALASIASPLIALILGPFLTHRLAHSDYGALAVLTIAIAFLSGITQLGLASAFFRVYSLEYESQRDRLNVLSTTFIIVSLISISTAIGVAIVSPWLSESLFHAPSFSGPIRLAGLAVLLQNLTVPGFAWLRAQNRAGIFAILAIGNLLVNLGGTIFLVGVLHMGIAGSLLATVAGYAFIVLCTLPIILIRAGLHLRFDIARALLSFGLPVALSFVSIWVLQLSDRYLLSYYSSLSETASYSVAYTLGGALTPVIIAPFALAWPTTMYAIARKKNAARVFQLVFRWFSIVLLVVAFGLSILAVNILYLLFPPSYHSAAPVIPIVALSSMFYGIYVIFTLGIYIQRKPWLAIIFTSLAALVNVGFNFVLIPQYGSMGAAASTLIAYTLLALIAYLVNRRIYPVRFEVGKFTIALFIGIVLYIGENILTQNQRSFLIYGISIGALLLYSSGLVLFGAFPKLRDMYKHRRVQEVFLS